MVSSNRTLRHLVSSCNLLLPPPSHLTATPQTPQLRPPKKQKPSNPAREQVITGAMSTPRCSDKAAAPADDVAFGAAAPPPPQPRELPPLLSAQPQHQPKHAQPDASQPQPHDDGSAQSRSDSITALSASRLPLYKDRQGLYDAVGFDRSAKEGMILFRQAIKTICAELGHPLERNYGDWDEEEMADLVNRVTASWNETQRAEGVNLPLSPDVVDAVIHRLCLDHVHSAKAKAKRQQTTMRVLKRPNKRKRSDESDREEEAEQWEDAPAATATTGSAPDAFQPLNAEAFHPTRHIIATLMPVQKPWPTSFIVPRDQPLTNLVSLYARFLDGCDKGFVLVAEIPGHDYSYVLKHEQQWRRLAGSLAVRQVAISHFPLPRSGAGVD
ncbi:hypothetical protein FN846DRAFT_896434 [Sphaerosporella brunnea]|uniref:Uncharacterized protein n=1 Tax=Sphaerosporella brunnea TaxID=1250544 RepID=A0A5J5ECZ1_9PEZI|nr:hypothetical protein FN846DRAFT_896434 [Sphaerosporella brunnea]